MYSSLNPRHTSLGIYKHYLLFIMNLPSYTHYFDYIISSGVEYPQRKLIIITQRTTFLLCDTLSLIIDNENIITISINGAPCYRWSSLTHPGIHRMMLKQLIGPIASDKRRRWSYTDSSPALGWRRRSTGNKSSKGDCSALCWRRVPSKDTSLQVT